VFSAYNNKSISLKHFKEELIFADFFSPNGDGNNDTFVIKNIEEYPINKIHIFNRWGEIVYQSEPYRNDWDGTMNIKNQWFGNVLPEGIYFYRFEFIIGDFITQRNGKIILKR
jgi:gliding motility-associated-like protein